MRPDADYVADITEYADSAIGCRPASSIIATIEPMRVRFDGISCVSAQASFGGFSYS